VRKYKPSALGASTIVEAKRLLDSGLSKSYVMRNLRIGQGSVNRIAAGTLTAKEATPVRCPGCGGLLEVTPCIACETRTLVAA